MSRDELVRQIKDEYARLADMGSREHVVETSGPSPGDYYENLLEQVIKGITEGKFDEFNSVREIVEAVANNRAAWGIV